MEKEKLIGAYICSKRKEHNLTQKELADKLFVTESAISKWERNKSFPDISLVLKICQILEISEHEFLTASEDLKQRKAEHMANKYLKLIKAVRTIQLMLYMIPLIVCFICNIAINHTLSWFWVVLTGEMIGASLTLLPTLLTKKRFLISIFCSLISVLLLLLVCAIYSRSISWLPVTVVSVFFGFSIVFLPFILQEFNIKTNKTIIYFMVETIILILFFAMINISTKGTWFFNLALPISAYCLAYAWLLMLIIRFTKLNKALKTSACLFISGIFIYFIKSIIDKILFTGGYITEITCSFFPKLNIINWTTDTAINENIITLTTLVAVALGLIFLFIGLKKKIKTFKNRNNI